MTQALANVLLIGYGNPGRLDDGLGPAFAEALDALKLPGVTVDSNYQLMVEDARTVADHDVVVFVDAAVSGAEPFTFRRAGPYATPGFSTHSVRPEELLGLADELFGADVPAYILGVRGYEFNEFGEALSDKAKRNLAAAIDFLVPVLKDRDFDKAFSAAAAATPAAGPGS